MRFRFLAPMVAMAAITAAALAAVSPPPASAQASTVVEARLCLSDTSPCEDELVIHNFNKSGRLSGRFAEYRGSNHLWYTYDGFVTLEDPIPWKRIASHGPDNVAAVHILPPGRHWFALRDGAAGIATPSELAPPKNFYAPRTPPWTALEITNVGFDYIGPYDLWLRPVGDAGGWRRIPRGYYSGLNIESARAWRGYANGSRWVIELRDPNDGGNLVYQDKATIR